MSGEPLLAVADLRVGFARRQGFAAALTDFSLRLSAGEAVALVGESAAGKSLAALALLGLLPTGAQRLAGSLEVGGRAVAFDDEPALRKVRGREVGLVLQEPQGALNPVRTVGAQLVEALAVHAPGPRLQSRALEWLRKVGLDEPQRAFRAFPHELSGGQRQRALIALALAPRPRLLIADEPTSALDATSRQRLLALLARLREELGLALLLISHDLPAVRQLCQRVAVLYAGEIVEEGPLPALFSAPAHPYTRALLGAAGLLESEDATRVAPLPGAMPSPDVRPRGCAFHPRCPLALARCASESPAATSWGEGRVARCHLLSPPEA